MGKWCLITDLSFPIGQSVNDGIDPALCSLHYTTVEDIAKIIAEVGKGALLAKFDIESAYRLIPVHPQDSPLQAMRWEGKTYIDPMLPFGLRSAPKIFNAVADALNWHLQVVGSPLITWMITSSSPHLTASGVGNSLHFYTTSVAIWACQ